MQQNFYKGQTYVISGNLLETLTDFLKYSKQRVVLNRQSSSWSNIEARGPQGSILGPLLVYYLLTIPHCFL